MRSPERPALRSFASIAAALLMAQLGLCGLRGFGLHEGLARAAHRAGPAHPAAADPHPGATAQAPRARSCHAAAPGDGEEEPAGPGCRDHCRLLGWTLPAQASGAGVPPALAPVPVPVPLLQLPAPSARTGLFWSRRLPPGGPPLPILHASLQL